MKKIFIIFIFFFLIINKNAECQLGWFSYSYSYEFIDSTSIKNHSWGYETLFSGYKHIFSLNGFFSEQWVSIFVKGVNNSPALELKYEVAHSLYESNSLFLYLGPGLNLSYNFSKNIFGISPQFNFICIGPGLLKLNLIYRYNFYIDYKNTHEIGLTVSLFNFPTLLFTMAHYHPLPETDE